MQNIPLPLVVLIGRPASGKTTLQNALHEHFPKARYLRSYTTRKRRPGEKDQSYTFLSEEAFGTMVSKDCFAWTYKPFGTACYGTTKSDLLEALEGNATTVLLLPAAIQLYEFAVARGFGSSVLLLYLWTSSRKTLKNRLIGRGETAAEAELKLVASESWDKDSLSAKSDGLPLHFIDTMPSKRAVLAKTLGILAHEYFACEPSHN